MFSQLCKNTVLTTTAVVLNLTVLGAAEISCPTFSGGYRCVQKTENTTPLVLNDPLYISQTQRQKDWQFNMVGDPMSNSMGWNTLRIVDNRKHPLEPVTLPNGGVLHANYTAACNGDTLNVRLALTENPFVETSSEHDLIESKATIVQYRMLKKERALAITVTDEDDSEPIVYQCAKVKRTNSLTPSSQTY